MAHKFFLAVLLLLTVSGQVSYAVETPCTGVDRVLPKQGQAVAYAVAHQMSVSKVKLLESFADGRWRILYVDNGVADDAFLFYADNPVTHHYVTLWAGAAMPSEQASILQWTETNARGIPHALAACFAWHVTQDRGR